MASLETGTSYESATIATKGVAEGDQIIISNQYRLQPNARVTTETQPVAANEVGGRT
jgi:hypothetical protein